MNKLLLSSICAAALTSAASAFTLDLSGLTTLGNGNVTNAYGSFDFYGSSASAATVSGGVMTIAAGQTVTITYPSNVTYQFAGQSGGTQNTAVPGQVSFTGAANVQAITFDGTVVPEPSSTALLGLGGLALILRRRK